MSEPRPGLLARMRCLAGDLGIHADVVERPGEDRHGDGADLAAAGGGAGKFMALAGRDGADDQPYDEQDRSDFHGCLQAMCAMMRSALGWPVARGCQRRRPRPPNDQPVPTPARCRARHARPTSSRLSGAKMAEVEVDVALMMNAMMKRAAAI